jgi:hypothetical protein
VVAGALALIVSSGVLVMLIWGVAGGRPTTPDPFAFWFGLSTVSLIIVAFQWSRWMFIGFAWTVVVLLLILVSEFGEVANQQHQLRDTRTEERLLVAQLGQSEHLAAAMQIKSLAASSPEALSTRTHTGRELAENVDASVLILRGDLEQTFRYRIVPTPLVRSIDRDQLHLARALSVGPPFKTASKVNVPGPELSIRWTTYFESATEALRQLCLTVGRDYIGVPAWLCPGQSPQTLRIISPAELKQALTPALAGVAAAVQDVSPSIANERQLATDKSALRNAFISPPRGSSSIAGVLSEGAGALVAFFEGSSLDGSWWYASLNTGAWVVLGLAFLIGLRGLLLVNNSNGWGPIELVMDGNDDAKPSSEDAERIARIRSYVIENVPEPASAPGSSVSKQITMLATSTNLGAPAWLRALANFAEWALLPPSGYRIMVAFRPAVAPSASEDASESTVTRSPTGGGTGTTEGGSEAKSASDLSVLVRISTRGRSKSLESTTIHSSSSIHAMLEIPNGSGQGKTDGIDQSGSPERTVVGGSAMAGLNSEEEVLRSAGYWAAGWILSHSKAVPPWAKWPASSGQALGLYTQHKRVSDLTERTLELPRQAIDYAINQSIDCLEDARVHGPSSGLILTRLAEEYEFKNDFVNALEINLQAAQLYPRYYVARYRIAVGLCLLLSSDIQPWDMAATSNDQQALRILDLLSAIDPDGKATHHAVTYLQAQVMTARADRASTSRGQARAGVATDASDIANVFLEVCLLSAVQLKKSVTQSNFCVMALMALRRDERRFWLARMRHPFLIRHNLRSAMPSIAHLSGYKSQPSDLDPKTPHSTPSKRVQKKYFGNPSPERVKRWAQSRNESAQVLYNLACYYALLSETGRLDAVKALEATQDHPQAEQIKASWMWRDPDLLSLHFKPGSVTEQDEVAVRFSRIVNLLRGGQKARQYRVERRAPLANSNQQGDSS